MITTIIASVADGILMTANEVELHRREKGGTALAIATEIRIVVNDGEIHAEGGSLEFIPSWDIDEWQARPISFQLLRNKK